MGAIRMIATFSSQISVRELPRHQETVDTPFGPRLLAGRNGVGDGAGCDKNLRKRAGGIKYWPKSWTFAMKSPPPEIQAKMGRKSTGRLCSTGGAFPSKHPCRSAREKKQVGSGSMQRSWTMKILHFLFVRVNSCNAFRKTVCQYLRSIAKGAGTFFIPLAYGGSHSPQRQRVASGDKVRTCGPGACWRDLTWRACGEKWR